MGVDRAVVAREETRPIEPQEMRVVILDRAWTENANLGGVNDPHNSHDTTLGPGQEKKDRCQSQPIG
jgi:hypothetical protein